MRWQPGHGRTPLYLRNVLLTKDFGKRQEEKKRIEEARGKYGEAFKKIEEMTTKEDPKGHEIIAKVKGLQDTARGVNNKVIDLSLANKDNEAVELMNKEARPAVRKWLDSVDELARHQDDRNKKRYDEAKVA